MRGAQDGEMEMTNYEEETGVMGWEDDIVKLQQELNIADLIKEQQRLDKYLDENGDDDEASDRLDNVRGAVDKAICEDSRIIAVTRWGRPVLDRVALDRLVDGLSDGDQAVVRGFVEDWYQRLGEFYEWNLVGAIVPHRPLQARDVVSNLQSLGALVFWEQDEEGEGGHWTIVNPTYTQCLWMFTVDNKKHGQVDGFWRISDHDNVSEDALDHAIDVDRCLMDHATDADRCLIEFQTGRPASTGPRIDLIPLLRELDGDGLAVGAEALPLMSSEVFAGWMSHYLFGPIYEPQVIEEAEAA
jgi:hypothetical protein